MENKDIGSSDFVVNTVINSLKKLLILAELEGEFLLAWDTYNDHAYREGSLCVKDISLAYVNGELVTIFDKKATITYENSDVVRTERVMYELMNILNVRVEELQEFGITSLSFAVNNKDDLLTMY